MANVKATLASVGDAEAFVGDLQVPPTGASYYNSELSSLVDELIILINVVLCQILRI